MPRICKYVRYSAMLLLCAGAAPTMGEPAGELPQEIVIDFEGLDEFTPINEQYTDLGVTFGLIDSNELPMIATQGAPATAFGGRDGSFDTPFVSGISGLTDPIGSSVIDSKGMVILFERPASRVRFWALDIDGGAGENWTDRCTAIARDDQGIVIDMMTFDANDPGTGDLAHTMYELIAPEESAGIFKVEIDVSDDMGYAIDDVRFVLIPEEGGGPDDGPGGGDDDGGDDPPAGGGNPGGTPGIVHFVNPIGQETLNHLFVFGRAFVTSEPDGGETYAVVPYENGAFEVPENLLPCGVPVYWSIVGTGAFGNPIRLGSRLDPIVRRPFADLTLDGAVDTADLGVMIRAFMDDDLIGDLNDDGIVDTADLGAMLGAFGSTCHD